MRDIVGSFLVFGVVFSPFLVVEAFSLFEDKVDASSLSGLTLTSQTGLALEPNVLPPTLGKKGKELDLNAEISIVSENALSPTATPKKDKGKAIGGGDFEGDIEIYVVHAGDTVEIVADMFGVSSDTILSANNMVKGDKLKFGDVLLIPPYSRLEHKVTSGETLQGIANKYKVDIDDILNANDLDSSAKIVIGERLMIPGGSVPITTKPKSSGSVVKSGSSSNVPLTAGYFVNPVPSAKKSRGVKPGHKGVDLAAPTGTTIRAAASGVVLIARNGWNGGFGNYAVIQHPNGCKTLYAHMSSLGTTPGAQISQGDTIGKVGSTGHSTGPHLHFETLGGCKNPF